MGLFNKLFDGDSGLREAMSEPFGKLKLKHPNMEEHEILALILHYRYWSWSPEITVLVAALFSNINELTEWVVGLANYGGPRKIDEYLALYPNLSKVITSDK